MRTALRSALVTTVAVAGLLTGPALAAAEIPLTAPDPIAADSTGSSDALFRDITTGSATLSSYPTCPPGAACKK